MLDVLSPHESLVFWTILVFLLKEELISTIYLNWSFFMFATQFIAVKMDTVTDSPAASPDSISGWFIFMVKSLINNN